jgi:hypothetical protein
VDELQGFLRFGVELVLVAFGLGLASGDERVDDRDVELFAGGTAARLLRVGRAQIVGCAEERV